MITGISCGSGILTGGVGRANLVGRSNDEPVSIKDRFLLIVAPSSGPGNSAKLSLLYVEGKMFSLSGPFTDVAKLYVLGPR